MMDLQYTECNICGCNETSPVTLQNDYRVVKCINCGLVFVNPRPDKDVLKEIYDNYHQRNGKGEADWAKIMSLNFRKVASFLNVMLPSGGRLLDIGCGYGHFINIMEQEGWDAEGIDPSANTLIDAEEKGLKVTKTTIDEISFPEGTYDAITMFYVLEHLHDPLSALKKVYDALVDGGVVIVRVPHTTPIVKLLSFFNIANNLYDTPFHLYDFSPASLMQILKKANFSSIRIEPGEPTLPPSLLQKLVSVSSGYSAKFLHKISSGSFLLPGNSNTAFAFKDAQDQK